MNAYAEKAIASGRNPDTMRFAPGNKLGGRPIGARNKLGSAFLDAMVRSFEEIDPDSGQPRGYLAICKVRDEDPSTYMKALAALMPKEISGVDGAPLVSGITVTFVKPDQPPPLIDGPAQTQDT